MWKEELFGTIKYTGAVVTRVLPVLELLDKFQGGFLEGFYSENK
jgi:hypothetical protein